jgi:hypothetical protein
MVAGMDDMKSVVAMMVDSEGDSKSSGNRLEILRKVLYWSGGGGESG